METMFLVFFLTNVALLPLGIVGVITGASALVDAFSAILAGIVIDKVNFKNGKYRPWLLICPPFAILFFIFCFTKIGGILLIGQIFFGMSYGLTSGFYAMCGTYGEYKTGESSNGLIMACCSLAIKIAVALRGIAITAFLGLIGYSATAEITPAVQGNIRSLYGLFPVLFIALSLIPLLFFKLDDKQIKEMEAEISKRREKATA